MSRLLRDERGLSVVEMTIVAALFFVILASVLAVLDSGTRTERSQEARHTALLEMREAMTRMTKDIRQALEVDPTSSSSHLKFVSIDNVDVEYRVDSVTDELVRSQDGGTTEVVLADHVETVAPFCYDFAPPDEEDPSGHCLAETVADVIAGNVTKIRITLASHPDVFSGGPITLATDVQLRNA